MVVGYDWLRQSKGCGIDSYGEGRQYGGEVDGSQGLECGRGWWYIAGYGIVN